MVAGGPLNRPLALAILVLAAVAPWATLLATNAVMGEPTRAWDPEQCTRRCHDRGCHHDPVLPEVLTGDEGLYGKTIHALFEAGAGMGLGRQVGYALANLLFFCALWPGLMWGLLAVGLEQRVRIRGLRKRR